MVCIAIRPVICFVIESKSIESEITSVHNDTITGQMCVWSKAAKYSPFQL